MKTLRASIENYNVYYLLGVEHIEGDMFMSVPEGDAIFLKVSSIFESTLHASICKYK